MEKSLRVHTLNSIQYYELKRVIGCIKYDNNKDNPTNDIISVKKNYINNNHIGYKIYYKNI